MSEFSVSLLSAVLCCFVLLTGCSINAKEHERDWSIYEPIAKYKVTNDSITFSAESNGCTQNESFTLEIVEEYKELTEVIIVRSDPDHCRRKTFIDTFMISLDKRFSNKPIKLLNPNL